MTNVKRFRFGVLAESVQSAGVLVNTARRAEDAGFATFLMRDHFVEEPFGHQFAPFTALATVASVTKRLRVGSLVFSNDYRHPLLLAKEAATLDVLSGGRLELGLGTGFESREYEQTGLSLDSTSVRAERLGEGVQILKKAFAGEPFTFAGTYYSVTEFKSFPPSLQRPHPPLLIGGGRGQLLSIAAKETDIVGLQMSSTAHGVHSNPARLRLAETVMEKVRLLQKTAGDRFGDLELSVVATIRLTRHRATAAEQLAADRNWTELSSQQVLDMPSVLIGSAEEITDEIRRRREQYAISYYVVSDRSMDAVAPIVKSLSGQ